MTFPALPTPLLAAAGVLALAAAAPAPTAAQDAVPLARGDLVRMLEGGTYTLDEVARMIRRACLAFRLTGDDLRRFRELGATEEVVDALVACRERGPAADGALRLVLPDSAAAPAGDTAVVRGRVERNGRGVPDVPVVLETVDPSSPGDRRLAAAISGPGGRIVFRVPTGPSSGRFVLGPRAASVAIADSPRVELVVRPGPPRGVDVRPGRLRLAPGRPGSVTVRVRVSDAHGNGVPGVGIALAPEAGARGPALARGVTGPRGEVRLSLPADGLRSVDRLGVWARDSLLAWIPVQTAAPDGEA